MIWWGIFEEAQVQAVKEVVVWQLAEAMREKEGIQEQAGDAAEDEPYSGRPYS